MKWIQEFLPLFYEWLLTFSNRKSFFSSKRIERFWLFTVALSACTFYLFKGIYNWELQSQDILVVCGMLFGYAGYIIIQTAKDKSKDEGDGSVQ